MAGKNFTGANSPAQSYFEDTDTITREPDPQAAPEKKPRARKKTAEQKAKRDRWLNAPAGTREPRSKRTQILLPPSLHDEAKAYAEQQGISLNELVIRGLYELLDKGEL